jgi:hypothetical protein
MILSGGDEAYTTRNHCKVQKIIDKNIDQKLLVVGNLAELNNPRNLSIAKVCKF